MAESKSTKTTKAKEKTTVPAPNSAPEAPEAAPKRTTTRKTSAQNSPQLVKKTTTTTTKAASTSTRSKTSAGESAKVPAFLEPENFAKMLHERPFWIDEVIAVLFMVLGLVTLLSLLNTSQTTALSSMWSNTIRQLFGYGGAVVLSVMIMSVGVLMVLPKIGVRIAMPWTRVVLIELGYLAFLGLLHLLAHDPEPRALARSGLGGGYIGWAVSEPIFKLFGSGLATVFFAGLMIGSLAASVGVRRRHVRQGLLSASKRLEAFATRMKQEPLQRPKFMQRPAGHVRPVAPVTPVAADPLTTGDVRAETRQAPPKAEPMARPLRQSEAESAPAPEPAKPVSRTGSKPSKATEVAPRPSELATRPPVIPAERPTKEPKPARPVIEPAPRVIRHFTVEDFKEVRQPLNRNPELPSIDLLSDLELNKPTEQEVNNNVQIIENTLLEFDIDVEVVDVKVGPTVTQYAVQPFREVTNDQGEVVMQRVRVNKIASLANDLALALAAKRLRIQPYVPGHPYMGIEVPNRTPSTVAMRPVMESETFARAFLKRDPEAPGGTREVPLAVPLGRDVSGSAFVVDLASMPHLLIAGTTGSGKSVCITATALALVMNNLPSRLNLVMLDPKMVELTRFNGLPHLLGPVETDMERIIGVLRWATREMDNRYKLLEAEGARNIETYNKSLGKLRESEKLPYIVILVDEIGDLMLSRPDEMERTLTRLAQMARAVGMHLIVATQRPSVDIITGLIKANFPARISFAVASGVDSRVILDTTGAETLVGRGDMLYLAPDASGPQRLQGCFVADSEIDKVVNYWKDWQSRQPSRTTEFAPWERAMTRRESLADTDPMLEDAIDLVVREGEASASLLQRRLGIGYPRAAQLIDMLAELGVLGGLKDGGRSREVVMKPGTDTYKKLMDKRKKG